MKCTYAIRILVSLTLILISAVSISVAQDEPVEHDGKESVGLSGKVVDTEGNPLPGFTFAIQSTQLQEGMEGMPPEIMFQMQFQGQMQEQNQPGVPKRMVKVKTDEDGSFSAANLQPGYVQINPIPEVMFNPEAIEVPDDPQIPEQIRQQIREREIMRHRQAMHMQMMRMGRMGSDMQVVSIQLNKLTFYNTVEGPTDFQGLTFGLKAGTHIDNVKITIKKRLKIRAQIVYADGKPLANANPRLSMRFRGGEFGSDGGTHGTSCHTDTEGFFTQYREEPGFYTLLITYKGFSGGAGPFILTKDQQPENIVIKLDGSPAAPKRPTGEVKKVDDKARRFIRDLLKRNNNNIVAEAVVPGQVKPEKLVWIINPANGHAYAKISCKDWYDAQQKAIDEDSHLLSLNDEDEQLWIDIIFGSSYYWIGLNDVEEEGLWKWDSGEPVTYTNWATQDRYPQDNTPDSEKDYVAVTFFDSGWQSTSQEGLTWRRTNSAIIEKDGLVSKIPKPKAESEVD